MFIIRAFGTQRQGWCFPAKRDRTARAPHRVPYWFMLKIICPYHQIQDSGNTTTVSRRFTMTSGECDHFNNKDASSDDLVALKISLLGDNHIGKTSFLEKYVGKDGKQEKVTEVMTPVDKVLTVKGARIFYSIWEVGGDAFSLDDGDCTKGIREACKDSVAMLFMFDLTSRCTLNSVINWYQQARKYNQTAIPVMVGSKFDDFIEYPIDMQWTISSEARAYAKAINATLFFSSASYNINVNKIFKFVTAKLFNLPWTLERNLKIGEPIIDF
ncbi:Mitochondrial Rho-like protein [Artemisia annua]|uniref:Mitochondrial Rho-like protein n=1 Tax=Artemisia annua TaxID=35608 RepID=A0A2U1N2G9_ARTAN|nr:Mitochondrial Rho-like protein [Artemisia annua]